MAADDPGGPGGKPGDQAVALAEALALEAVRKVAAIMRKPARGSGSQLAAARLILDVAGVGAAATDQRHTELLAAVRGKLSRSAEEEVIRALAETTSQRGGAPPDDRDEDPGTKH